ncbi:MAG TPA: MlaD family protein [Candidatus Binataceae bacterium]|nr:MlaD family protein [Candidatus Binataceae bacterium]
MADGQTPLPPVPESRTVARRQRGFSLVWIIPIVAALAGTWVAVTRVLSEGPKITITFDSAEGLEAGKTKIQYKGVDVGTLTAFQLSPDHQRVIATVQMAPKTEDFLVEDTQFWVVRPRISGANVTGLGTLISGAFIGMEIGVSKENKRDFVALETPPVITGGAPGRFFVLKTPDLGSLDTGTPVFFRRLQVGRISSYQLDEDGQAFTLKVFVRAPYDRYVTPNTRFWQASGIDLSLSAAGLTVQTQSLLSILIGGIAFETPTNDTVLPAARANTAFILYDTRREAFEPPARYPQTYQLIFNQSVRGLEPGAPVDFRGIQIGEVAKIQAQVDMKHLTFSVPVTIHLDPQRLGVQMEDLEPGTDLAAMRRKFIDSLVAHGVRAQLQTGNLLTGSVYVALDFFPGAPPATVDWSQRPVRLPTVPGQLEATEASVEEVIRKVNQMPLQQIGDNLQRTLADLDLTLVSARGTLASARGTLDNANTLVAPDSLQGQELDSTLQEIRRAARSIRVLADYLERHPEALIRGKRGEAK